MTRRRTEGVGAGLVTKSRGYRSDYKTGEFPTLRNVGYKDNGFIL